MCQFLFCFSYTLLKKKIKKIGCPVHCECNCILLSALIRRTSCLSSCKYSRVIRLILKFWILPSFLCKIRKKKKAMERLKMILQPFVERKCKNIWQGCWVLRWDHSQVCESGIVFCNESHSTAPQFACFLLCYGDQCLQSAVKCSLLHTIRYRRGGTGQN